MKNSDVVILCGGLGKRLRKEIGKYQKVMAEVLGHPFLDNTLCYLKNEGFKRVILCTGYQAKAVEDYYRTHAFGLTIEFSKEAKPLGTGGAVKHARRLIKSNPFVVLNGDSFCRVKFNSFVKFHKSKKASASIVVSAIENKNDFGSICVDSTGRIESFKEKTKSAVSTYVNAGIYCFDQEAFSFMPRRNSFSLEYDFFPRLIKKRLYGFKVRQKFIDIGTPERYRKAEKILGRKRTRDH